ncbi:hypothetical protein TNCV_3591871 [Trichonephila clavipes]|nr:hypothetical protein TNCV_3591871 [Trichonephila clavipes]
MGAAISNVLQPRAFVWFEKTQGPLMKVPPVPSLGCDEAVTYTRVFRTMWQSSDDWSVEDRDVEAREIENFLNQLEGG